MPIEKDNVPEDRGEASSEEDTIEKGQEEGPR
jgi:hypothetical protein